tara:strand:- start:102 stop:2810 length:2709 start_codon:yes stop_codon:yes gene_type:complete
MALSWNEIKDRALKFSKNWEGESKERAEKDSFYNDFFNVFGLSRRRFATFEEGVKKLDNKRGLIDLFWKGTLLIEHKSKGKDLTDAIEQAKDYLPGIKEVDLPKYILVSDFEKMILLDLDDGSRNEFYVSELYKNVKLFGFMAGYSKGIIKEEDPVNVKAAELMGKFHDQLEGFGYEGHQLEVYLSRLLFILFADDTSIFEKNIFKDFIDQKVNEDGSDLGALLAQLFQVLNTPLEKRFKTLDEHLNQFPYINGGLFEETLPIASFNSKMRSVLLEASNLDWGKISPAIFGSLFQSVMNPVERRNLGAHYTSEQNILKVIKPLFLDELELEFEKAKSSSRKLKEFHLKISKLKFLDPACGSGNFLIITYKELRLLEIKILKELFKTGQQVIDISSIILLDIDKFYGIEYDEFASRIAEVGMWLIDHQMNMLVSEEFGQYFIRLPLKKSAHIFNGNALRINWEDIVSKNELSYIIGNPPFNGTAYQNEIQKEDMKIVFDEGKNFNNLDYVSAWFFKAARYIEFTNVKVGFVSTNSIVQGQQAIVLWKELINKMGIYINFAHQTFIWANKAKNKAAVHVVIICFSKRDEKNKFICEYLNESGEPSIKKVESINQYLVNAPAIFIEKRTKPVSDVSKIGTGSAFLDDGNFILSEEEKVQIIGEEPFLKPYIKRFVSSREFINNQIKWCFWLKNIAPSELKKSKILLNVVQKVREFRQSSKRNNTRLMAEFPTQYGEQRQPTSNFLLIPKVSSKNRAYIPIGYMDSNTIITDKVFAFPDAGLYGFGVLNSIMHMTWVRITAGRLKSDYSYSNTIVYNNFPWPFNISEKNKKNVEMKAQNVLNIRSEYPETSLADLYHKLTMPPKLIKAHQNLDKAVDLCYSSKVFKNDSERIQHLFELYSQLTINV